MQRYLDEFSFRFNNRKAADLFGMTVALLYHLANGVRHLVWDTGHGLDVKSANASAVIVLAFAVAATLAVWGIAGMTGAL